jgi:hypothetical protein
MRPGGGPTRLSPRPGIRGRRLRARPQHRVPRARLNAFACATPGITPPAGEPSGSSGDLRTMGTSLRLRTAPQGVPTTIVEKRLSKAGDEAVREVAVGGCPAVTLREADSQKRRVTLCSSLRPGDTNTRRSACDEEHVTSGRTRLQTSRPPRHVDRRTRGSLDLPLRARDTVAARDQSKARASTPQEAPSALVGRAATAGAPDAGRGRWLPAPLQTRGHIVAHPHSRHAESRRRVPRPDRASYTRFM